MTREQVMKLFPEATDEQVTGILNAHHAELQTEKKNAEDWKAKAGHAKTLEQQLAEQTAAAQAAKAELEKQQKEAANKNLSTEEVLQKKIAEIEQANAEKIATLQAQLATSEINAYAASKNLSGENFAKVLNAFNGDIDLAKAAIDGIFALKGEWETGAALAKEQEIAKQSGNPGINAGSTYMGDDFGKNIAIQAAKRAGTANEEILKHYRR